MSVRRQNSNKMTTIAAKAFAIGEVVDTRGGNDKVETRFGARTDVSQRIENFTLTASVTDSTIRDVEAAPWLKDAIITAETTEGGLLHAFVLLNLNGMMSRHQRMEPLVLRLRLTLAVPIE